MIIIGLCQNLSSTAFSVDSDDDDAPCRAQLSLSGNRICFMTTTNSHSDLRSSLEAV